MFSYYKLQTYLIVQFFSNVIADIDNDLKKTFEETEKKEEGERCIFNEECKSRCCEYYLENKIFKSTCTKNQNKHKCNEYYDDWWRILFEM